FVFVIKEDVAHRTRIKIGERIPGWAQALQGISGDAVLITEGLQKVRDGQPVRIMAVGNPATDGKKKSGKVATE
ncbi:MAG: membrane fusion protein (multidrug efflux system), partial [Sneathiella sp.]